MSRRNFVREIKAKEIKNLNPSDIIYMAMKDGSIILIVDDDEDTIEFDDLKMDNPYKKDQKFYKTITDTSLYSFEKEINYKTNASSNNFIDNKSSNSISLSKVNTGRDKNKIISKERNIITNENKRINKNINYNNLRNEKLDKSVDNIRMTNKNIGYHEIGYFNNIDKSFNSYKFDRTLNDRPKSNINYIINNEQMERNYNSTTYDNNRKNLYNSIDISNLSFDVKDRTPDRTERFKIHKKDINKKRLYDYEYENFYTQPRKDKLRSKSSINDIPPYSIKRKEMEIMGRIVNDTNSYKNIDHHHPNTLFDPICYYCQALARENRLTISNIKTESIYDNYSFLASFGSSGKKKLY